jgi:tRNA uridine 5-carboxymethylaminomethyl modification enzyme
MLVRAANVPFLDEGWADALLAVEVELKYSGYVQRERDRAAKLRARAEFRIPPDLAYAELLTLSHEAREKLARIRPATLAQASRVSGVSPADLQNLMLEIRKRARVPPERFTGNMTVKQLDEASGVSRET